MKNQVIVLIAAVFSAYSINAQRFDRNHWSLDAGFYSGAILPHNPTVKNTLHSGLCNIYSLGFGYHTLPSDSCLFAASYNYPVYGVRLSVADFSHAKLIEGAHLGNIYSVYGFFERPIICKDELRFFYSVDAGFSYATNPHNWISNPNNPFVGSRLMVYVGASLGVSYRLSSRTEVGFNVGLRHYSCGRLAMPNSGINIAGSSLSFRYFIAPRVDEHIKLPETEFDKEWLFHISAGMGVQSSLQEYKLDELVEPQYRRSHYKRRPKFSLSADAMYRYSRKFATGIGIDLFHTGHTGLLRQWDAQLYPDGRTKDLKYSGLAVGIAINQEIYYRRVALNASLGYYVFRRVGLHDKDRFYQWAGLRYYIPRLDNIFAGISIKAHRFTQAEYLEFSIGLKLTKSSKKQWKK